MCTKEASECYKIQLLVSPDAKEGNLFQNEFAFLLYYSTSTSVLVHAAIDTNLDRKTNVAIIRLSLGFNYPKIFLSAIVIKRKIASFPAYLRDNQTMLQKLQDTLAFLQDHGISAAEIGIVLGTGLGKLIDEIEIENTIDYGEIPHFPVSTVESHKGKLIYGKLEGRQILAMQGRFHYYEGYTLEQVTFPVRVMKKLGIRYLLLSNAAGALNLTFQKGSLMLLDDHINFLPDNPLRGLNYEELGPRFPDMSRPYSKKLNALFKEVAKEKSIDLKEGIYVAVMGPNLETRAEYRMFRDYADAVGMSTVPEVIVANHMNLPCAAVSVLTDECDPDNLQPAVLAEILQVAAKAEVALIELFKGVVSKISED